MPRLGTESTSSTRRHTSSQSHSSHHHLHSQGLQSRSQRSDSPLRGDFPNGHATDSFDSSDDLPGRARASGSRTRWNARISGSPYGHRPLPRWSSTDLTKPQSPEMLNDTYSNPGSDDGRAGTIVLEESGVERAVAEGSKRREREAYGDEEAGALQSDSESEADDADSPSSSRVPGQSHPPLSAAVAKRREKNKKKKAKARAKAKARERPTATSSQSVLQLPPPPEELIASMARVTKLLDSLDPDASEDNLGELLRQVRDALTADGRATPLAQWQADVLQRVRRMEDMLGQMAKWKVMISTNEIEALKQETERLEVRVREVLDPTGADISVPPHSATGEGQETFAKQPEMAVNSSSKDVDGQAGAREPDSEDADSVSDSAPESSLCTSDNDTGASEPDPEDHSPQEEKGIRDNFLSSKPTATVAGSLSPLIVSPPVQPNPIPVLPDPTPLPPATARNTYSTIAPSPGTVLISLAPQNHNVPPEPPEDPVEHLKNYPWTMVEVLLLLEVVGHYPPAEHGWKFIAEAYNNLLITRPIQEWFQRQAGMTHEEDTKMMALLKNLSIEAHQLRTSSTAGSAKATNTTPTPKTTTSTAAKAKSMAGQRGKAAPFGSAEARAEANARAKPAATANASPAPGGSSSAKDAHIVTRLPFPIAPQRPADDPSAPPPAQRLVPFPRRRPPITMPSADAKALSTVMRSAAAGQRPHRDESRAAMFALFAATKTRFVARSSWDCWHRWSTPWVAQDETVEQPDVPVVVSDYVAGNLVRPFRMWDSQGPVIQYRPLPGTYPNVVGVQHKVVSQFDPRAGMVAFTRMTHLLSERAWTAASLGRATNGRISDEVLAARKARPPPTLAGIWPGKGTLVWYAGIEWVRNRAADHELTTSGQPMPKPPQPQPAPTPARPPNPLLPRSAVPVPPKVAPTGNSKPPSTGTPPPASASASKTSVSGQKRQPQPQTTGTIDKPAYPFRPLPQPSCPPKRTPPRVPERTLGNMACPGLSAWFDHAAVRLEVLQRLVDPDSRKAKFDEALGGKASAFRTAKDDESDGEGEMEKRVRFGLAELARDRKGVVGKEEKEKAQKEADANGGRERGGWLPLHLQNLVIPPPQRPPIWSGSSSTMHAAKVKAKPR